MAGGGKGGKQTTSVQIPAWLESAAQQNLARADRVAQLGYTPYFGPDVAAMTPNQIAAMQNTANAASAFGMAAPTDVMAGMPAPQTFAGGVQGYSSAPLFQQSVDALRAANPGQVAAMEAMFLNPQTGAAPAYPFAAGRPSPGMPGGWFGSQPPVPQNPIFAGMDPRLAAAFGGMGGSSGSDALGGASGASGGSGNGFSLGGYTGIGDMFDGGGPGASGGAFSGGGVYSAAANALTGR